MQMVTTGAEIIGLTIGALILALSVWGIVVPNKLLALVRGIMGQQGGIQGAVLVRLILGLALLIAAPASRYPSLLTYLGWLALIAAAGLGLMGRARLLRFVGWFDNMSVTAVRLWLVVGIVFGAFLIHALL